MARNHSFARNDLKLRKYDMQIEMQNELASHQTIGRIVAARPSRARVFERLELDYCCGGKKQLGAACRERGLNVNAVLRDLRDNDARASDTTEADWTSAPLDDLIDHIVTTHHAYLREALPRLTYLIDKVVRAHGDRNPALSEVAAVFAALRRPLECHTEEEESVVFPLIQSLAGAEKTSTLLAGLVRSSIETLEREHDQAGAGLETLRKLTDGYVPPAGACNTYRAMLDGLAELEADMHRHVHKENSILFPRALELAGS